MRESSGKPERGIRCTKGKGAKQYRRQRDTDERSAQRKSEASSEGTRKTDSARFGDAYLQPWHFPSAS